MFSLSNCRTAAAAVLFVVMLAAETSAQGFISPFIGATSGGPTLTCAALSDCEKGSTTFGVGLGTIGGFFGFEFNLGYTKAFLGELSEDQSSGLLTAMGNIIVGPKLGPVQPYAVGGLGILKLNVDLDLESLLENSETKFAWDAGAGIIIFFGQNIGVRGDLRYFRTLQDFEFLPLLSLEEGPELDFTRATAAVVFKF